MSKMQVINTLFKEFNEDTKQEILVYHNNQAFIEYNFNDKNFHLKYTEDSEEFTHVDLTFDSIDEATKQVEKLSDDGVKLAIAPEMPSVKNQFDIIIRQSITNPGKIAVDYYSFSQKNYISKRFDDFKNAHEFAHQRATLFDNRIMEIINKKEQSSKKLSIFEYSQPRLTDEQLIEALHQDCAEHVNNNNQTGLKK